MGLSNNYSIYLLTTKTSEQKMMYRSSLIGVHIFFRAFSKYTNQFDDIPNFVEHKNTKKHRAPYFFSYDEFFNHVICL